MFIGTDRVPGNQFDVLMESGGGANNASTSTDRTNYYSWGPRSLLPTLMWLDADRLDGLSKAMTAEKVELQVSVVRNERRQGIDNQPYGVSELIIPDALYPAGHPYQHSVIGSPRTSKRRPSRTSRPSSTPTTCRATPLWWWRAISIPRKPGSW